MATNTAPPTIREIVTAIPVCPACGCDRYTAVPKLVDGQLQHAFVNCEKCDTDILAAYDTLHAPLHVRVRRDQPTRWAIARRRGAGIRQQVDHNPLVTARPPH